ncbi:MAG: amidohydrolase [Pseudomonadales bacterium]|nr:amidohydrolase [Pseudomonadales bacterium]
MRAWYLAAALLLGGCATEQAPVDMVLRNGAVYTMNPSQPKATALAIDDGRIIAVGNDSSIARHYKGRTDIDLHGQMVLPGFHDSHMHPVQGGVGLALCELSSARTIDAIIATVKACDTRLPAGDWLTGSGWDLSLFKDANPGKALLDAVSVTRPIFLGGADGHSSWANSKALEVAGINRETPDPPAGIIERDDAGNPSGTLRESAQDLARDLVPPTTPEAFADGLRRALAMANSFGITSIDEAWAGQNELDAYRTLLNSGELTARVVASVDNMNDAVDTLVRPADRGSASRLHVDAVKIFVDGVLEGETAALLEPYLDSPGFRGDLKMTPKDLAARVTELDRRGIQVHMHAIGDRAVRAGLDAIEAATRANGPSDNRHQIAHLQLVDAADRPRFAELGVTADFEALWAYPDQYITDVNLPQVGEDRVNAMYPIGSILRSGGRIVGGSDWPVSSMNPLDAIEVGVRRQDPGETGTPVLNAGERVSLDDMLAAYTINGAWLMHEDDITGSLQPGKMADIVILARDLHDVAPEEINEVPVTMTLLEGKPVYRK